MPQKTNGGSAGASARQTRTHALLGYSVASEQPGSAAKSKSNIPRSPRAVQAWPLLHNGNYTSL